MRSAVDKVMWVGRGTVFLVGLVTILVLAFLLVNAVLGAAGGPSLSGKFNQEDPGARWAAGGAAEQALAVEPVARRRQVEIPRGYAHITLAGDLDTSYPSKGVNDVMVPQGKPAVYCFDLTFVPKAAVASPHLNNSAVIGTVIPPSNAIAQNCPATHRDAVAHTYGSNTGTDAAINFQIMFL